MTDKVTLTIEDIPRSVAMQIIDDCYGSVYWHTVKGRSVSYPDSTAVATIEQSTDHDDQAPDEIDRLVDELKTWPEIEESDAEDPPTIL